MQDAVGVTGFHPPDEVATRDQALVSLVDRVHVDAEVQGGADDCAHGCVHPRGVASAGENPNTGRRGTGLRHDADLSSLIRVEWSSGSQAHRGVLTV